MKVWYAPIHDVGTHAYPVYGFIYGGAKAAASAALDAIGTDQIGADKDDASTDG